MRYLLFFTAAAALGVAIGTGFSWAEFAAVNETFRATSADLKTDSGARADVVGGPTFEFGVMRRGEERSHTFQIQNVGTGVLTIRAGETSCSCTLSDIPKSQIAPGETAEVTVTWTPKSYSNSFQQTAEVFTNDPEKPVIELMIKGMVTQILRPAPDRMALTDLNPNTASTTYTRLYTFQDKPFEVLKTEFTNPDTAEQFRVVEQRPLTAEEVAAEAGAFHGVFLRIEAQPGLPLGPVHQSLKVTTSYENSSPVEIDIFGEVRGDISIMGSGKLNLVTSTVSLGRIDRREGESVKLYLLAKGEHAAGLKITDVEIEPASHIHLDLEEPEPLSNGSVLIRFTVKILPDQPAINRLGTKQAKSGRVLLKTNHPKMPDVPLYVRFVTE
jgi:hypothetical protein